MIITSESNSACTWPLSKTPNLWVGEYSNRNIVTSHFISFEELAWTRDCRLTGPAMPTALSGSHLQCPVHVELVQHVVVHAVHAQVLLHEPQPRLANGLRCRRMAVGPVDLHAQGEGRIRLRTSIAVEIGFDVNLSCNQGGSREGSWLQMAKGVTSICVSQHTGQVIFPTSPCAI